MKRPALLLGLTLAGIMTAVIGIKSLNAQPETVKRTVILKADLLKMRKLEGTVLLVELAPGGATGIQEHSGNELAYVLQGSIILEAEGETPETLKAGDAFYQPLSQAHNVKNASTTEPAKVLTVLVEKVKKKKKAEEHGPHVEPGQPTPSR